MGMRWTKKEMAIIMLVARNTSESMTARRRAAVTQHIIDTSVDVEGCPELRTIQAIIAKEKEIRYELN